MLENVMYLWIRLSIYCVLTFKLLISLTLCLLFMETIHLSQFYPKYFYLFYFCVNLVSILLRAKTVLLIFFSTHSTFLCNQTIVKNFSWERITTSWLMITDNDYGVIPRFCFFCFIKLHILSFYQGLSNQP